MADEFQNNAGQANPNQNINVTVNVPPQNTSPYSAKENRVNKHVFVWVCNFLFGCLGVDRFIRGQIGMGVFKLLLGWWITLGIWPLVDFIISLVKAYSSTYFGGQDDIVFINGRYAR